MADEVLTGIHAVSAVLEHNPARVRQVYINEKQANNRLDRVVALADREKVPIYRVPRNKLDRLSTNTVHQGIVALCQPLPRRTEKELLWDMGKLDRPAMLLVLDGIQDPHNLGACVRSVSGAGGDGVVIARDRSAPITPVVHRAASGAMETMPVYTVTNIARTLAELKQETGLWIYGTSDRAEKNLYQLDLTTSFAIVLGAEGKGIRRLVAEQCDELVSLPMLGSVNSLNVSVAAGVCVYEAMRQRMV
jgi:23S rRNA (guanosine2251-2'-O)-methyltransferase